MTHSFGRAKVYEQLDPGSVTSSQGRVSLPAASIQSLLLWKL